MARYLDVDSFKKWWNTEKTADDPFIEQALVAATISIDVGLKRRVELAAATATPRLFRPRSACSETLWISDCVEVASIVEAGVTLDPSFYQLDPPNGLSAADEPVPYDAIERLGAHWLYDGQRLTVTVTATWGWPQIPPIIVESCKIVAADWLANRYVRHGLVDITEAGGVGTRENRLIQKMIAAYGGHRSIGIG